MTQQDPNYTRSPAIISWAAIVLLAWAAAILILVIVL
jgi:hypothetical protein